MLAPLRSLPLKRTLLISAMAALVLDVLSSMYFLEYWQAQGLSSRFVSLSLMVQGGSHGELDPHFISEIEGIVENTVRFILMMFLIINTVFYSYLPFQKKWSWQYVFTYTSTASLLCFVTAVEQPKVSTFFTVYNILAIFLYALLALVLWSRKLEVKEKGFRFKSAEQ